MNIKKRRLLFFVLIVLALQSIAYAHLPEQNYIYLQIDKTSVNGRFEVTSKDLNKVFKTDLKAGMTKEDVAPHLDKIKEYILKNVRFSSKDEGEYKVNFKDIDFLRAEVFGDFLLLNFKLEGVNKVPEKIDVEYSGFVNEIPGHTALLLVEESTIAGISQNESIHSLEFSPNNSKQTLNTTEGIALQGLWAMIKSGVWHIWIGFDHILFLLALLLPSVLFFSSKDEGDAGESGKGFWQPVEKFKPALFNVLKIVTFFTIAHSITLCLAALDVVTLPSRLVESIIAISIALAAFHNIYPLINGREWLIAFIFGLFHGFGFAGVLAEKGLGGNYLVLSVFGFNLGVELGQIAIIAIVFPILFILRKSFLYPKIRIIGSILLILIALYWFLERAFDLDFPVGGYILRALGMM